MASGDHTASSPLPRLDRAPELRERLLPLCRLAPGALWDDPLGRHRVGCLDAAAAEQQQELVQDHPVRLAIQDPPYNLVAFEERSLAEFTAWCRCWVEITCDLLHRDAYLYVWLGADQKHGFQPLPDFMLLMRERADLEPLGCGSTKQHVD